jgi:hypothetical protein
MPDEWDQPIAVLRENLVVLPQLLRGVAPDRLPRAPTPAGAVRRGPDADGASRMQREVGMPPLECSAWRQTAADALVTEDVIVR